MTFDFDLCLIKINHRSSIINHGIAGFHNIFPPKVIHEKYLVTISSHTCYIISFRVFFLPILNSVSSSNYS